MGLLGETLDLLERIEDVIGFTPTDTMGPSGKVPLANANPAVSLADSPIIAAAQLAIMGLRLTTGDGHPDQGDGFEHSSKLYQEAGLILIDATPDDDDDRWDGSASRAYKSTTDQHRHLTLEVAKADQDMHVILRGLAARVRATKANLDDALTTLSNYDTATSWLSFVPGGSAAKATLDAGMAAAQLDLAQVALGKLVAHSIASSFQIHERMKAYGDAALQPMPGGGACAPFADEHTGGGRLPTRTDPHAPYVPPKHRGPIVDYPPAAPYDGGSG